MTILDLAFASLRVLGFWLVLQAVVGFLYLTSIHTAFSAQPDLGLPATRTVAVLFAVAATVAGISLLRFAYPLALLLTRHPQVDAEPITSRNEDLQRLGLLLLGAFLLAEGAPQLVRHGLVFLEVWRAYDFARQLPTDVAMMRADVLQALVKVAISLVFLFGPASIVRALQRLRGAPIPD